MRLVSFSPPCFLCVLDSTLHPLLEWSDVGPPRASGLSQMCVVPFQMDTCRVSGHGDGITCLLNLILKVHFELGKVVGFCPHSIRYWWGSPHALHIVAIQWLSGGTGLASEHEMGLIQKFCALQPWVTMAMVTTNSGVGGSPDVKWCLSCLIRMGCSSSGEIVRVVFLGWFFVYLPVSSMATWLVMLAWILT